MSVCLSVPIFFYIIEEIIEVDELDEGSISAAAGKYDKLWMTELSCATLELKLNLNLI